MPRPDSELDDLGAIADSPAQAAYHAEPAIRRPAGTGAQVRTARPRPVTIGKKSGASAQHSGRVFEPRGRRRDILQGHTQEDDTSNQCACGTRIIPALVRTVRIICGMQPSRRIETANVAAGHRPKTDLSRGGL
jgi:hypothetical protein